MTQTKKLTESDIKRLIKGVSVELHDMLINDNDDALKRLNESVPKEIRKQKVILNIIFYSEISINLEHLANDLCIEIL